MKSTLLALLSLIFFSINILAQQNSGVIEGKIVDHDTKQIIVGAVVEVIGTKLGATTNELGDFKITGIPTGTYNIKISAAFYAPTVRTDVFVGSIQSSKMILSLKISNIETEEVVIKSGKLFEKSPDFSISTNILTPEEIRRAPGAAEDVSRMAQSLPGVAVSSDARNDLIVRGGSPIENFIMIDGIEVPNINHFGTQGSTGGPIGMINVDFLNDMTFSAGGFAAKYGDRLSSIMDLNYRDGDKNHLTGKLELGMSGAGLLLEGPIQEGKSSFLFSARKSYLDLFFTSLGLTAIPNYTNYNFKATYDINENHKIEVLGLAGVDRISFDTFGDKESPYLLNTISQGWRVVGGLSHKWLINKESYLQSSFSVNVTNKEDYGDSTGVKIYTNEGEDKEYVFRTDYLHRLSKVDLVEAGFVGRFISDKNYLYTAPGISQYDTYDKGFYYNKTTNAYKFGTYLQFTRTFLENLNLTIGLRQDYFDLLNEKNTVSPRASASYSVLPNLKINAAWGVYYQTPPMIWLTTEANNYLKQMRANQWVVGLEYYPTEDIKIQVEAFDKKYTDYPSSSTYSWVSYANTAANYFIGALEDLTPTSTGKSRGVELYIQKKLTDHLYGMINYSLSEIRFEANDKIDRASAYDYKNIATVVLGYKFNNALEISMKWRYAGGRPYTPLDQNASAKYNQTIYDNSRYLSERLPDYHRLDLRVDYRIEFKGWAIVSFLDFENLYNRENVDYYIWDQKKHKQVSVNQWSFIPAGGFKVEF